MKGWGQCDRPTSATITTTTIASIPFMLPVAMESVVEIAVNVLIKE